MFFLGLFVIPLAPVSYAFAVELTFPVPEQVSNGIIILPAKFFGTALGITCGIISQKNPQYALGIFSINALLSFLASLYIKEDLRRLKYRIEKSN
jgi:purine-cytosine permease-like protein